MTDAEYSKLMEEIIKEKSRWSFKEDNLLYATNGEVANIYEKWWVVKLQGYPVFLDELNPKEGIKLKPIVPDCGSLCEIKYADIIDKRTDRIYRGKLDITQLYSKEYINDIL